MSDSRGRWPVAVSVFAALSLLVMSAATVSSVAAAPRPVILSISVSPKTIPAKGGPVVIRVSAAHTTTCTLSGVGIRVLQVPCGGPAAERLDFTANGASRQHVWTIDVIAKGAAGQRSASRSVTVTEGAANPLDACAAGPNCDDRLVSARYNTYGDLAPAAVGDCTFAAAADWEHITLGKTPDPSVIRSEFAAAGGNAAGLSTAALWRYWRRQGIDGVVLSGLQSHQTNRADVESGVRASGAMLVELQFRAHDHFAQYSVTAGEHLAVVDGFTPEGPLVVSWGQTLQITWQQWNAKAIRMWGITTRPK